MPQTRRLGLALATLALAAVGVTAVRSFPPQAGAVVVSGDRFVAAAESAEAASHSPTLTSSAAPQLQPALVAVSVAEVWSHHAKVRPFDAPALQRPARLAAWLHRMSFYQRSHLFKRLATQVRFGELVEVLGARGQLSRIRIPDQTGGRFPDGIVGWVASRQLEPVPPDWGTAKKVATVTAKRAALDRTVGATTRSLTISYGTTLPVVRATAHRVVVAVPGSVKTGWLPRVSVRVHGANDPAIRPSARQAVVQAKRFLGLPYLWAGMTSWGYDCSGLTSTVFGVLGLTLPRDAADQSLAGTPVSRSRLRPGDLVFFSHTRNRADIHHVAIYAGRGRVLQAPYTGARVQLIRLRTSYLNAEYWGAARLIP